MGGGDLFRSLLHTRSVDTVEVGIIPILLGGGIAFLPGSDESVRLELTKHERFPSGIVLLKYDLRYSA